MLLHYSTVRPELMDLIKRISADIFFNRYRLVGGTSLSLQIGHRTSVGADFFSDGNGQPVEQLVKHIFPSIIKNMAKVEPKKGCMGFTADGVKIDIFDYGDPFVKDVINVDGIKLASLIDIGLMKLDAQNRRNAWKDLIDLNAITELYPLEDLLLLYNSRYPSLPLKQCFMSLIHNLDSPPSMTSFPSDLMIMDTKPNEVVSSLRKKCFDVYRSMVNKETNDIEASLALSKTI